MTDREAVKAALGLLVDRMREDSLDAVLAAVTIGHGKLVIQIPRSMGSPVEAAAVLGGVRFEIVEDRQVRSVS